jgi:hypothetical protein
VPNPATRPSLGRQGDGVFRKALQTRWGAFALLAALLSVVSDGWSGKPSPLTHQLLLLPCLFLYTHLLQKLLEEKNGRGQYVSPHGILRLALGTSLR